MSSDSEGEDLKRAIALSLADSGPSHAAEDQTVPPTGSRNADFSASNALDLKSLHEARVARTSAASSKRDRSISPPLRSRKAPKLETTSVSLPSGAMLRSFTTTVQRDQQARKPAVANAANSKMATVTGDHHGKATQAKGTASGGLAYPRGAVKTTWALGHERTGNDIKLEEVLEPSTLRTAVISAFQWDAEWILSKLRIPPKGGNTKCVFIMQAVDEAMKAQMTQETEHMRSYLKLCFPFMKPAPSMYSMHSKLMLLFHPEKLRVAVPTANMLNFDWGETGVMENMVFVIDLPRLREGHTADMKNLTSFAKELLFFLKRQGLGDTVLDGVTKFDFSATEGIAFVHTVGGMSYNSDVRRTGWAGLSQAVRELGLQTQADLQIDFVTSSCGVLNDTYLKRIHESSRGLDLVQAKTDKAIANKASFFDKKTPKSKANSADAPGDTVRKKIRIYFPTSETVKASTAGAVGTICLDRKTYQAKGFPRDSFRDYHSKRRGLLSHSKVLYARGKADFDEGSTSSHKADVDNEVAWVYIGSANISQAAWGEVPKLDDSTKEWKVWGKNWECGVLLPVRGGALGRPAVKTTKDVTDGTPVEDDDETESESETSATCGRSPGYKEAAVDMSVFDEILPVPCDYPGALYNGKKPWFFKEQA